MGALLLLKSIIKLGNVIACIKGNVLLTLEEYLLLLRSFVL